MSFYCSTEHGEVRVKEGVTVPEEVLDKVFEVFNGDPNIVDDSVFLSYEGGWHEDLFYDTLQLLAPYITEGEVEFSGEDSQHFRYIFPDPEHPDSGEWSGEQQSRIVWDGETGFTPEENSFIKELLSHTAGHEARNMLKKYSRSFGTDVDTDDEPVSITTEGMRNQPVKPEQEPDDWRSLLPQILELADKFLTVLPPYDTDSSDAEDGDEFYLSQIESDLKDLITSADELGCQA